jgi:hypothetical protein
MIRFRFDIDKAIAATAYVIQKGGGRFDVFALVKMLYDANRIALVRFGRSITGDTLASMDKGPIVSDTYDLIKKRGLRANQTKWNHFITEPESHVLRLVKIPDLGVLSTRELAILDEAFKEISAIPPYWLSSWTHQRFPEWKDPKGSSLRIDPAEILRIEKKSDKEISEIEDEINSLNAFDALLNR